jgi:hypothetical protein
VVRYNLTGAGVSAVINMTALGSGMYACAYTFTSLGSGNFSVEVFLEDPQVSSSGSISKFN